MYCVREPHLHALFTCPSPRFAAASWHLEQTSAPSSVSQSWGLLADKSEGSNCSAGVGIGLFSAHAHQNFCTLTYPSWDYSWGQPLLTNIILEYFSHKIMITAAFLSQELLLVTWLLLTNLFAVSPGGEIPGFQKKIYLLPPSLAKRQLVDLFWLRCLENMIIKDRRPELASTATKALKSFLLMVSGLPEKNSSHFLLLIQQFEETANKHYNTAFCFNQTPVPLFFIWFAQIPHKKLVKKDCHLLGKAH